MRTILLLCFVVFLASISSAQYCDFQGKDSLFVTVQQDTIYLWDMAACAYCGSQFSVSVNVSADTVFVVQTDTGRITLCDCVFNLRASIAGLARGTYWIVLYRDLLRKYGYSTDEHKFIGVVRCAFEPTISPGLSWTSYQSNCNPSFVLPEPPGVPGGFTLLGVYPNPFNPGSTVQFRTPRAEHVVLKVYDVLGREIQTLLAARIEPGLHNVVFRLPQDLNSGVYYCRMTAGSFSETKAIVLLR